MYLMQRIIRVHTVCILYLKEKVFLQGVEGAPEYKKNKNSR